MYICYFSSLFRQKKIGLKERPTIQLKEKHSDGAQSKLRLTSRFLLTNGHSKMLRDRLGKPMRGKSVMSERKPDRQLNVNLSGSQ